MHTTWSRRSFLTAGALLLAACSKPTPPGEVAHDGSVTVDHAFGKTKIPSAPKHVVCAGLTGQDEVLALGTPPIAVSEWLPDQPSGIWPWARTQLGSNTPAVLSLADGIQIDKISALKPDLIVATNAGLDSDTYSKLAAVAPTLAQSDTEAFFEPWQQQATAIGQAMFRADDMAKMVEAVGAKFVATATANPGLASQKVFLLHGDVTRDGVQVITAGWRTAFLTKLGMQVPGGLDRFSRGQHAVVPRDQLSAILDGADALIWTTDHDKQRDAILADPAIKDLNVAKTERIVFPDKDLSAAIAFSSVLSLPVVADRLPPLIIKAVRG